MTKTISAVLTRFPVSRLMLAVCLSWTAAHGQTITKCQDEDGNWHYGDFASEACARESKITEINDRGIQVRETDAPPTQEELEAREAAKQEAQQEAARSAEQAMEEQRLLQTYDTAQSIIDARDKRLEALDRDMESYRLFRQDLVEEKSMLESNDGEAERISDVERQIQQYDEAIQALQKEHRETMEEFNKDLDKYRELTGEEVPETAE